MERLEQLNKPGWEHRDIGAEMEFVLEELDKNFVGMNEVKEHLRTIGLRLEANKARGKSAEGIELRPIILVGNPGTGKSSLAELLPQLYFHYGLLGSSKPIVIYASELADRYVGGAQEKIFEKIREAQDVKGFLFVDGAHELLNEHFDGKGVLKAFMASTTDKKKPFLACFAVYENKLEEFLKIDPGAKSRFQIIRLRDYNAEELFAIMKKMVADSGNETTEETDRILKQVFERMELTKQENTGNARKVKRILEEMEGVRLQRCVDQGIPFDSPGRLIFVPEDIPEKLRKNYAKENESATNKLEQLNKPGWEPAYQVLSQVVKYAEMMGGNVPIPNFVLTGNPGTGKTAIAHTIGEILREAGILKKGHTVAVTVYDLIGLYIGQTPANTRKVIEQAEEGVLLIDDAHMLSHVRNNDARDIIAALLSAAEDPKQRFTLVLLGYKKEMEELLKTDPEFGRILQHIIHIDDFCPEELFAIMKELVAKDGNSTTEDTDEILQQVFQKMCANKTKYFGNAREVYKLYEDMKLQYFKRRMVFLPEDVPQSYQGDVKATFQTILRVIEMNLACRNTVSSYNFVGQPETEKQTFIDLLGKLYYQYGLTAEEKLMFVSATNLIKPYLGQTSYAVNLLVQEVEKRQSLLVVENGDALVKHATEGVGAIATLLEKCKGTCLFLTPEKYKTLCRMDEGFQAHYQTFWFE